MDLSNLRIKLIFKNKKKRNPKHIKPYYSLEDVVQGLPSQRNYGVSTLWFIRNYCPHKMYLKNMYYLFDNKEQVISRLQEAFATSTCIKKVKDKKKNVITYESPSDLKYTPSDIINMFSKNSVLVTRMFNKLNKLIHSKLSYKHNLEQHEKFLSFLLSRLDSVNYDIMAIPFAEHFFNDNELGFKDIAYFEVLNVLISSNYFYRTHGTGILKRKGVITLDSNKTEPETYDEANYIPSLLVPDYKIKSLMNSFKNIKEKKENLIKNIYGRICKLPVQPLMNKDFLTDKVYRSIIKLRKHNLSDIIVIRRSKEEFLQHYNKLGFISNNEEEIEIIYNKVLEIINNVKFNYTKAIHIFSKCFRDLRLKVYYRKGAFKYALQYIMYGQTNNKEMNNLLGLT